MNSIKEEMKAELRIEFVEEIRKAITFAGQIGDYVINQSLFDWLESKLYAQSREIEELKQSIRSSERFRITDAASAISEANQLREKIKEQELIIYGIEEGSGQWQSLCADKEREITDLKADKSALQSLIDRHFQTLIARNYNNIGVWSNERQQYNFELIEELERELKKLNENK